MEAGLAKIHVPFLYARIFATGHPLLSIQNFPPLMLRTGRAPATYSQNNPPLRGNFWHLIADGACLQIRVLLMYRGKHFLYGASVSIYPKFSPFNGLELGTYASEMNRRGGIYCL